LVGLSEHIWQQVQLFKLMFLLYIPLNARENRDKESAIGIRKLLAGMQISPAWETKSGHRDFRLQQRRSKLPMARYKAVDTHVITADQ